MHQPKCIRLICVFCWFLFRVETNFIVKSRVTIFTQVFFFSPGDQLDNGHGHGNNHRWLLCVFLLCANERLLNLFCLEMILFLCYAVEAPDGAKIYSRSTLFSFDLNWFLFCVNVSMSEWVCFFMIATCRCSDRCLTEIEWWMECEMENFNLQIKLALHSPEPSTNQFSKLLETIERCRRAIQWNKIF